MALNPAFYELLLPSAECFITVAGSVLKGVNNPAVLGPAYLRTEKRNPKSTSLQAPHMQLYQSYPSAHRPDPLKYQCPHPHEGSKRSSFDLKPKG